MPSATESSAPRVTVVLLSHNRPHLLREALDSVMAQDYPVAALETIVVDNRSDASPEIARLVAEYPSVTLVANERNLGFTGGMNVGLAVAKGEFVYLAEDDLTLSENNVSDLVNYLARRPDVAVAAGVMLAKETRRVWFAGGEVRLGWAVRIELPRRDDEDWDRTAAPFVVTYISGAAMMARREVWQRLGGFREDFFMYWEDVELCQRVLRAGMKLAIVPSTWTSHTTPKSGRSSEFVEVHKIKNLLAPYTLHADVLNLPGFFLRSGPLALARHPSKVPIYIKAWAGFARMLPSLLRDRRELDRRDVS
jgi:GT2 family glycosyltransferase